MTNTNFDCESDYQIEIPPQFKNQSVKNLYDVLHTSEVANFETVEQITEKVYPYIEIILADENAYTEASQFRNFYPIVTHIENQQKTFVQLDMNSSLCFELFCYIYH